MKDRFCIQSSATFERINRAVTNNSLTKQTFSFSKSKRFQQHTPTCPLPSYAGELIAKKMSSSATSMGYGGRSDFTKCLAASPSANLYHMTTFWDQNKLKKKGVGFALGREQVAFNDYLPKQPLAFPSATSYNNEKILSKNPPKYSLRQKTILSDKRMTIEAQNRNPGPGSYINPEMESLPSYKNIGKFQKISFGQSRSKRFYSSQNDTPGPGVYEEVRSMPKKGSYILSQNKGGTKAKFDLQKRESVFEKIYRKELNPGPGSYQTPSEFGQYDGNIYDELRSKKKFKNGQKSRTERKRHN